MVTIWVLTKDIKTSRNLEIGNKDLYFYNESPYLSQTRRHVRLIY